MQTTRINVNCSRRQIECLNCYIHRAELILDFYDFLIVIIFSVGKILSAKESNFTSITISVIIFYPIKRQPHKMVKHAQKIRRQQPTNCLSVFYHFLGLVLKVIWNRVRNKKAWQGIKRMWVMTFVESMLIGSYLLLGILLLFYFTIMFVSKTKHNRTCWTTLSARTCRI